MLNFFFCSLALGLSASLLVPVVAFAPSGRRTVSSALKPSPKSTPGQGTATSARFSSSPSSGFHDTGCCLLSSSNTLGHLIQQFGMLRYVVSLLQSLLPFAEPRNISQSLLSWCHLFPVVDSTRWSCVCVSFCSCCYDYYDYYYSDAAVLLS